MPAASAVTRRFFKNAPRDGVDFGGGAGTAIAAPLAPATARMSRWQVKLGEGVFAP